MRTSTSIWVGLEQKDDAKTLIENNKEDDPLLQTQNIDDLYISDGALYYSFGNASDPFTVHGELIFSGSEEDRNIVKKLAEIVGLHQEKLADDRGRISLGSQYSGKTVKVAVIGLEEGEEQ